jgi:uncharacterized membrane protein YhhN
MKRISLYLFLLATIGELVSHLMALPVVHLACKPALLMFLLIYYMSSFREMNQPLSRTLVIALIFSWGGDVLLMKEGELYFILGLVSFLLSHLCYIFTFRQFRTEDDTEALHGLQKLRFAFPIVLYGTGLVVILLPHLGELGTPVMLYALVLTLMALNALFRFKRTTASSFTLVFAGAILFMISDSLLAINKFLEPIPFSGIWIMSTYIGAQFLIVTGLLKHNPSGVGQSS